MDNQGNMTITSVNSTFYLTVPGLYDTPQKVEGYATDSAVSSENINPVVAEIGVDGKTSYGYVPTNKVLTVSLAADSKSREMFDNWISYQDSIKEVMVCSAEFTLPAIQRKYVGMRGAITAAPPMPGVSKTLQSTAYTITFESWIPSTL
jgi:hypothetical protein